MVTMPAIRPSASRSARTSPPSLGHSGEEPGEQPDDEHEDDATVQFAPTCIPAIRPSGASCLTDARLQPVSHVQARVPQHARQEPLVPRPAGPSPSPAPTHTWVRTVRPYLSGSRRGTVGTVVTDAENVPAPESHGRAVTGDLMGSVAGGTARREAPG